ECLRSQPCSSKLLIARITQAIRARKPGWFRTDSGTSYRLSKSDSPPVQQKGTSKPNEYGKLAPSCQHRFTHLSAFSTGFLRRRGRGSKTSNSAHLNGKHGNGSPVYALHGKGDGLRCRSRTDDIQYRQIMVRRRRSQSSLATKLVL